MKQLGIGSRPTSRCAAWRRPGSSARSATSRAAGTRRRSAAPERHGAGARHVTARARARDGLVADHRRRARLRRRRDRGLHGDTSVSPLGMDTYGSRSLTVGGIALHNAAQKIVAKARTLAAHQLGVDESELSYEGGVPGTGDAAVTSRSWPSPPGRRTTCRPGSSRGSRRPPSTTRRTSAGPAAPRRGRRDRHADRRRAAAPLRRGRRRRPGRQPDDRRRPDPRRDHQVAQALYEEAIYDEDGSLLTSSLTNYLVPPQPSCRTTSSTAR